MQHSGILLNDPRRAGGLKTNTPYFMMLLKITDFITKSGSQSTKNYRYNTREIYGNALHVLALLLTVGYVKPFLLLHVTALLVTTHSQNFFR